MDSSIKYLMLLLSFSMISCQSGRQEQAPVNSDRFNKEVKWNTLPANQTVIAKQKTVTPTLAQVKLPISGSGYISFDVQRNRKLAVRVGGRIERLYVKYNFQYVKKGDKILDIYSPELNTYLEEYNYLNRTNADAELKQKAHEKLSLLGLSDVQINQISRTGVVAQTIPLYSPYTGYVLFNPSETAGNMGKASPSTMGQGMGGNDRSGTVLQGSSLADNSIREGMYVSKNQTLFWVNDFRQVWGLIAFGKENEKYLHKGMPVKIKSELQTDTIATKVQLIEQVYGENQKFTQARVYLENKGLLKQNSLITGTAYVQSDALMVPASSVYYVGRVAIVWIKKGTTKDGSGIFEAREVKTGYRDANSVAILEGLSTQDSIAKDAGYMADSETIIKY
ncbi:MAG: efflux RND transporter periplasmic adaptor subunit [Chitinophagales bacterium]|nr:efflux RND transporter periplasmic adaptor subunit [Chitinophagales bacterium]